VTLDVVSFEVEANPAPAEVRIERCHHVAPCRARRCGRRGPFVARYLDSMGRFLRQFELCDPNAARLAIRDQARGIVVVRDRRADSSR
jgi:hypothetical protein